MARSIILAAFVLSLAGCSVVTLPIKVAAKTVTTTVDTAATTVKVASKVVDLVADTEKETPTPAQ